MVIALVVMNVGLVLVAGILLLTQLRTNKVVAQKEQEDANNPRVVGIRTKDGQELRYMGDEVPSEIMRLVDQKYWITEKR